MSQLKLTTFWLLAGAVLFASLAPHSALASSPTQISAKLWGRWVLGESENYDEYLAAKGYSWVVRWVIARSSCTRTFTPLEDGTFQLVIETPKNKVVWDNIRLGQPFEADYLDDTKHTIRFDYVKDGPERLIETHKKRDGSEETYEYRFDTNDNMFMTMEEKGVVAKRFYSKTDNTQSSP